MLEVSALLTKALEWGNVASLLLFVVELALVGFFIFELFIRKNKKNRSFVFLAVAFLINAAMYIIPCVYELKASIGVLDVMYCLSCTFRSFVGEWDANEVKLFAQSFPFYTVPYVLGSVIAPIAAANVAAQVFSLTLLHNARRRFMLHSKTCDIVLGTTDNALQYAKDRKAIIIPNPAIDGDAITRLIERGYIVWPTTFSPEMLSGRKLNFNTTYNIVCPGKTEENLENINVFIAYHKAEGENKKKKIRMYVEIEGEKTEVIRREIIDKSCCKDSITPFCSDGLLAVKFAEEHPVTEHIPERFIEWDSSIKRSASINVMYLGFGSLNREMYRRSVLNNQLVEWLPENDDEGEYILHPVNYHLVDMGIDSNDWFLDGLKKELTAMEEKQEEYYALPELPYNTVIHELAPDSNEALDTAAKLTNDNNSFCYIIIDVKNSYKNIEIGTRLRYLLGEKTNYHIYIRCDTAYIEDDDYITYLGDITDIFTHEVIVNDSMFILARKINEVYAVNSLSAEQKKDPRCVENKIKEANEKWEKFDSFTRFSNFYAAMNLRLKLQLLGLDYIAEKVEDEENKNAIATLNRYLDLKLAHEKYDHYFKQNKRNSMLAQEKMRWNAYHLYKKVMPKKRTEVRQGMGPKTFDSGKRLIQHACITTYTGLDALTKDLFVRSSASSIDDIEYYKYDDQLLCSTVDLMKELGYTIVEKK